MSGEHWLFDCVECASQARRGLMAAKAEALEVRVRKENNNVAQKQLVALVEVLRGGEGIAEVDREAARREAFRVSMGLFRKPGVLSKEARAEMTELPVTATESLIAPHEVWAARQEEVAAELRKERLGR